MELATLADRAWFAYHCLPRDPDGKPPAATALEERSQPPISRGTLSKTFSGKRTKHTAEVMDRVAKVLHTTVDFLLKGEGEPPKLTGPLPPRPASFDPETWEPAQVPEAASSSYSPAAFPNLETELAARAHLAAGGHGPPVPASGVAVLRRLAARQGEDFARRTWQAHMDELEDKHRRAAAGAPQPAPHERTLTLPARYGGGEVQREHDGTRGPGQLDEGLLLAAHGAGPQPEHAAEKAGLEKAARKGKLVVRVEAEGEVDDTPPAGKRGKRRRV
jgi:transcriptional regulator with XRE-family HTH domain